MAFFNWYFLLFYSISLSCGLLIFRVMRTSPPRPKSWLYKAIAVLGVTWVCNIVSMQWAALWGGMVWLLLIVVPSFGGRKIQELMYHQDYQRAYRWTMVLRYFHPFDGWWEQPQIVKALQWGQRGDMAAAQSLLARYAGSPSVLAQQAIAMNDVMNQNWSGLLQWLQTELKTLRDPLLVMYYCRALGEMGYLHELLLEVKNSQKKLIKGGNQSIFYAIQLFTCAFCGEVQLTQELLLNSFTIYPRHTQQFWLAIAHYAAGEKKLAEQTLKTLQIDPKLKDDNNFIQEITQKLKNPPPVAKKLLTAASYPLIAQLTRDIYQTKIDQNYQFLVNDRHHPASFIQQIISVNFLLVLINIVVFIFGILFDLKFGKNSFIDLGSFIPKAVWSGEWWRIITATFIHLNWTHITANMLTLYLLGHFVEKHLGKWRYLLVYLGSGFGAMLCILLAVTLTRNVDFSLLPPWTVFLTDEIRYDYRQWVGASGSIMGMIGAIATILWRGWSRHKSPSALKQFKLIVAISILQFMMDLSSTNVSFYSHFLGLILGILLTLKLTHKPISTSVNLTE